MKLLAVLSSIDAKVALPRALQALLACKKQKEKLSKKSNIFFLFVKGQLISKCLLGSVMIVGSDTFGDPIFQKGLQN